MFSSSSLFFAKFCIESIVSWVWEGYNVASVRSRSARQHNAAWLAICLIPRSGISLFNLNTCQGFSCLSVAWRFHPTACKANTSAREKWQNNVLIIRQLNAYREELNGLHSYTFWSERYHVTQSFLYNGSFTPHADPMGSIPEDNILLRIAFPYKKFLHTHIHMA